MSDEIIYNELSASFGIRALSNKMEGAFTLYRKDESDADATFLVYRQGNDDLSVTFGVKVDVEENKDATFKIMYRENEHIELTFDIVMSNYLDASIEVKPNGRMFGMYEILPPPRVYPKIKSTADSYTRSREDLRILNYGTQTKMMIGNSNTDLGYDYAESFIKFDNFENQLNNMAFLEEAKLRLYYTGDFYDNTSIELNTVDRFWNEIGITHENKPSSQIFVSNEYILNRMERYIEFDVADILLDWINGEENYGFLIKSYNNYNTQFYTRESNYPPILNIQYVSNEIYSSGRSELEATLFIWGKGESDKHITFEVHSDYGEDKLESTLYIHRAEVPLEEDHVLAYTVSKPDLESELTVAIREKDEISAFITVIHEGTGLDREKEITLAISKDSQEVTFNVDPNAFLPISLSVKGEVVTEDLITYVAVSRPDLDSTLYIRAYDDEDLYGEIEVPNYDYLESFITVSKPDLDITFDIHTIENVDTTLYVKHREDIEATLLVMQNSDLTLSFNIKYANDIDSTFEISKPDLELFFSPRVIGEDDKEITWQVRQLDATDLDIGLTIKGKFGGAYYFIL